MVSRQQVLDALSRIIDPDFQKDIVSLGFVKDLVLDGGKVSFTIELTTPACPVKDRFREAAEREVGGIPGVESVAVRMTARPSARSAAPAQESGMRGVKAILAVSSCKGGVGKSTIAAMVAREIARRGYKAGLLDADIYGPSVPTLFNLHDAELRVGPSGLCEPVESGGLKLMSFGFMVKGDPAVMRGPMVSQVIQQLLHAVNWGELDYLVIDMPPGTGDIQLTICQSIQMDAALIVTLPHQLALADVAKGILMFDKVNVPVAGVVENMAWFACDGCGKRHHLFGAAGVQTLEDRFGVRTVAEIPLTPVMSGSLDDLFATDIPATVTDAVIRALGHQTGGHTPRPSIHFDSQAITLTWPGGETVRVGNRDLRAACACAVCIDEMTGRKLLEESRIPQGICALESRVVGNYAIAVKWSDGHNSGLYSYKLIRALGGVDHAHVNH